MINSAEYIKKIVAAGLTESVSRVFVLPRDTGVQEKQLAKMAVNISALANAGGGEVLIGITLKRKKAAGYYSFNADDFDEFWLEHSVLERIEPQISGVTCNKIAVHDGTYYFDVICVQVPNASNKPFRCTDKNYYIKERSGIRAMEECEIRGLYCQSMMPEIEVWAVQNTGGIPQLKNGLYSVMNFYPTVFVKNIGTTAEKLFKVELAVPTAVNNQNFDVLQKYFSHFSDGYTVYCFNNSGPLFPDELALVFEANFFVNGDNYSYFESGVLRLKVYYSAGMVQKEFQLKELLLYRHDVLEQADFLPGLAENNSIHVE